MEKKTKETEPDTRKQFVVDEYLGVLWKREDARTVRKELLRDMFDGEAKTTPFKHNMTAEDYKYVADVEIECLLTLYTMWSTFPEYRKDIRQAYNDWSSGQVTRASFVDELKKDLRERPAPEEL